MRCPALVAAALSLSAALSNGAEAGDCEESDFDRWSVGVSAAMTLPQGGSRMRTLGGAALRTSRYLTENLAAEGEVAWLEDCAGLGVAALWHLQGLDFYSRYFGYSRFDPFLSIGAKGWIGRSQGQVGPKAAIGAFYHLTDSLALRADADATLGLDTDCEMVYGIAVGVQYSF